MAKRFIGCQYPLVKTTRGIMAQKSRVDQIKADLLQLLLTNPGERVMLPAYGTPLRKLMFEPNDPSLEIEAKRMIIDSISRWEKRIELSSVSVTSNVDVFDLNPLDTREQSDHILMIKILFFDPVNINEVQELQLEVPIGGN